MPIEFDISMKRVRTNITFLDNYPSSCLNLKHRTVYLSKHNVSDTGFDLHLQVRPTQLGPIDRITPYLWTPVTLPRWGI
jgi:hypothetical protein